MPRSTPGTIATVTTPMAIRGSSSVRPASRGNCGRASRQASESDTGFPSTALLVTMVSRAVATMVPSSETSSTRPESSSAPRMAERSSSVVAEGSSSAATSTESRSTKRCSRISTTCVTTAIISDMPSTVRQCVRSVATAPSRISPTPSGRSGITPGLAAAGGWVQPPPPQPPPDGGVRSPLSARVRRPPPLSPAPEPVVPGADHWPGGGCSLDHFDGEAPGPVPSAPSGVAPSWSRSRSSEGPGPGAAQPGVSFIVAPSRCPRGRGGRLSAMVPRERPVLTGPHRGPRLLLSGVHRAD